MITRIKLLVMVVTAAFWMAGCATTETALKQSTQLDPVATPYAKASPTKPALDRAWLEKALHDILYDLGEERSATHQKEIPMWFINRVKNYIQSFSDPDTARGQWFARSLKRYDYYYPMVSGVFETHQLPETLYAMAMIESGFDPDAKSTAGAVGLWQFMSPTAKDYNLMVSRRLDERYDPHKSTVAAREYLLDLILDFGHGESALLAMAAYNAGEGRIRHRLRKLKDYKQRSFWTLSELGLLPKETKEYVPQILAAAIIIAHRDRFNVDSSYRYREKEVIPRGVSQVPPPRDTKRINEESFSYHVRPGDTLSGIAEWSGVAIAKLKSVNKLTSDKLLSGQTLAVPISAFHLGQLRYTVKRGDTLSELALKFGVRTEDILRWNGLSSAVIQRGKTLKIYAAPSKMALTHYRVQPGNSLTTIARAFGVSVLQLKNTNGLNNSRIFVGQRVSIPTGVSWKRSFIRVPEGASLSGIAQRLKLRVDQLQTFNGLADARIFAGQKLVIYQPIEG